jgi:hypothetical protein
MEKQAMYAEMRGNMEYVENIMQQIEDLSSGQMINMYEVNVKDMATFDTEEKVEGLRAQVSEKLGLEDSERLQPVVQDPKICAVVRDL